MVKARLLSARKMRIKELYQTIYTAQRHQVNDQVVEEDWNHFGEI